MTSTVSPIVESAADTQSLRQGATSVALDQRAPSAVVDSQIAPVTALENAIHSLRAGSLPIVRFKDGPDPSVRRRPRRRSTFGRVDLGDDGVATPDQLAMRAAVSLEAMPPLPRLLPTPRVDRQHRIIGRGTVRRAGRRVDSRISGEQAIGVGQAAPACRRGSGWPVSAAMRSLSPQRISSLAIASFSLTIGTQPSSSSRVNVWRAWRYWRRLTKSGGTTSTWAATRPWRRELGVVDLHQPRLADRGERLQCRHVVSAGSAGPAPPPPPRPLLTRRGPPRGRRAAIGPPGRRSLAIVHGR